MKCIKKFVVSGFVLFFLAGSLVLDAAHYEVSAGPILNDTKLSPEIEPEFLYILGPGNLIQIKIFGDASSQIYRVDEGGYIKHSLVGRVKLAGMTVSKAEELMEANLANDYIINPRVNVFVLEYSRFSILGEVVRPGTYEITGQVSLIEAISMAGGFTRIANQRSVKVMREIDGFKSALEVNAADIIQRGSREKDIYIAADDVIVIPKSFF